MAITKRISAGKIVHPNSTHWRAMKSLLTNEFVTRKKIITITNVITKTITRLTKSWNSDNLSIKTDAGERKPICHLQAISEHLWLKPNK